MARMEMDLQNELFRMNVFQNNNQVQFGNT